MNSAYKSLFYFSVSLAILMLFISISSFSTVLHKTAWDIFIYQICITFFGFLIVVKNAKNEENKTQILLGLMVLHLFLNFIGVGGYLFYTKIPDLIFVLNYFIQFLLFTCLFLYGIITNLRPKN